MASHEPHHRSNVQVVFGVVVELSKSRRAVRRYISTAFSSLPSSAARIEWIHGDNELSCTVIGS